MKNCNNFFKEQTIEIRKDKLIELLSKIISIEIQTDNEDDIE